MHVPLSRMLAPQAGRFNVSAIHVSGVGMEATVAGFSAFRFRKATTISYSSMFRQPAASHPGTPFWAVRTRAAALLFF
jgi:hypothetical protein